MNKLHGVLSLAGKHGRKPSGILEQDDSGVPVLLKVAIRHIDTCSETKGLYRISGERRAVQNLAEKFRSGEGALLKFELSTVHNWTSLIKLFLSDVMEEPLLTFAQYDHFVEVAKVRNDDVDSKLWMIQVLLSEMPKRRIVIIATLFLHLHRVSLHAMSNMMTCSNLGVVFGPTLLRPHPKSSDSTAMMSNITAVNGLVALMIEHSPRLFREYYALERQKSRQRKGLVPPVLKALIEALEGQHLSDSVDSIGSHRTVLTGAHASIYRYEGDAEEMEALRAKLIDGRGLDCVCIVE